MFITLMGKGKLRGMEILTHYVFCTKYAMGTFFGIRERGIPHKKIWSSLICIYIL